MALPSNYLKWPLEQIMLRNSQIFMINPVHIWYSWVFSSKEKNKIS